jgi:hypothetical protein
MYKTLTLGTLLLGCCLAAAAQTSNTPNPTPQGASTFPQDQTGQTPSNPASPADPKALPPDASAPAPSTSGSMAQKTTVQGCLAQSADGNFILSDKSGNSFQLSGDTSQLSSYVGNEIRVDGTAMNGEAGPGSMSSPVASSPAGSSESARQISVTGVRKVSDTCTNSQ